MGRIVRWLALGLTWSVFAACGDDSGGDSETGPPSTSGEPCLQEGFTETNCQCPEGGLGSRTCTADLVFTACMCRPPPSNDDRCAPGDPLDCTCPDGTMRTTMCLDEGTFDCPCNDAGSTSPPRDDDAGGGTASDAG